MANSAANKHGHNDTRFGISRADAAKQINGVGAVPDGGAVDRQIGKQLLNQRHCPEIEEIVRTEKRQRNDDGHKALMLQQADLRDHPPSAQDSVMTKTEISAVSSTPPSTLASVTPATAQ